MSTSTTSATPTRDATSAPASTISVALCTFDGAPWLGELLASLAAQTRLPDEVVVNDDGSSDTTIAVVEEFARTAPFPVHLEVNPVRLGSTLNFERVLERTTGSLVALADQDDRWYPTKLEHLARVLEDDPILTLAFSDAELLDPSGNSTGVRLWRQRRIHHLLTTHEIVPGPRFARRALSTGCTMVVRRRAVEAALPFPECLDDPVAPMRHDRWLSLIAAAVGTVRAVPEPLLGFRVHPDQQTGVLPTKTFAARLLGAAGDALGGPEAERSAEHLARARQIDEAADRADRFGDFEEADELRRLATHHRTRADLGATIPERLGSVVRELQTGSYDRSLLGSAAVAADLARALRPRR